MPASRQWQRTHAKVDTPTHRLLAVTVLPPDLAEEALDAQASTELGADFVSNDALVGLEALLQVDLDPLQLFDVGAHSCAALRRISVFGLQESVAAQ